MVRDASWLDTAGRLLFVLYFVITGLCNLTRERINEHIERMTNFHTPFPAAAFWIGIVLQFAGSTLLLSDQYAEIGVYCLIVFTVAATAIKDSDFKHPSRTIGGCRTRVNRASA